MILQNLGALENFAEGILAIADKYAVMPLKEQCERYMASNICKFIKLNFFIAHKYVINLNEKIYIPYRY